MFLIGPYSYPAGTMLSAAQRLSLTSGLVVCVDAGDINSYDGTSQTWIDVSGAGNSYYRGSGSGSDGLDPTFHGSAGGQSSAEYFQSDGGDAFWQTSSQTYLSTWHKDNATFTVAGWVYIPTAPTTRALGLCRNFRDNTDIGMSIAINNGPFVTMMNASGSGVGQVFGAGSGVFGQWQFACISFAEGTGTSFTHVNGTVSVLLSDTYSSPNSTTSPNGVTIMGIVDVAGTSLTTEAVQNESGQRINSMMAWSRALSQSEVAGIYTATKARFGL